MRIKALHGVDSGCMKAWTERPSQRGSTGWNALYLLFEALGFNQGLECTSVFAWFGLVWVEFRSWDKLGMRDVSGQPS